MEFSQHIRIIFIIFVVSSSWWASYGDPRTNVVGQFCNNISAVSVAVLANNFVPAMENLSSLVNQNRFGTAVVGQGPNAVFALAQCLKDLNSTDCKLCFSKIRSLLPKCYPNTGGRIYLDGCFGRYDNFSFFDQVMDSKDTKVCSFSKNSSQAVKFSENVKELIENVSSEAQRNQGFAVVSAPDSNWTVYALAQCWENLNDTLCSSCLSSAASSIISCTPATEGWVLYAGCYMRYSMELFWNLNQTDSNSSGKRGTFWIILGSSLGGFLLIVGLVVWKKRGFLRTLNGNHLRDVYGSGLAAVIAQSNLNFGYEELKKATKNFDISYKLGQGGYGTVYKAALPDGREGAVKRLFLNTRQWADQFFNEVDLINRVRHKNLVKLLGCSVDGPESLLVYEYYFNKSLDLFIFDRNLDKHLDWQKRFDIIQGVAEGLFYLHEESETRIIHRDIKASNILLDEKLKPKITDFGLARSFAEDQTHLSTGIVGTLGYMAPEYVVHGHLTEKADVYSFGILVLEIVAGKRCSSNIGSQAGKFLLGEVISSVTEYDRDIWHHYKSNTTEKIIDESIYEERSKDDILHVVHLALLCTQASPSYRPTMAKVVHLLRNSRDDNEPVPSEPPFLDVIALGGADEGEAPQLISTNSAPSVSGSSETVILVGDNSSEIG